MAQPENVLTLDHAPVVGESYMVPTVRDVWGELSDWPVMTPAPHSDEIDLWDWHLDYRFFTAAQEEIAAAMERENPVVNKGRLHQCPVNRWTGSRASRQFTIVRFGRGLMGAAAFPPVIMRPLVCRRPTVAPEPLAVHYDLARYGKPARALRSRDGRLFCPHQSMDLTHWPREADGTVICPLHRLRVNCDPSRVTEY